MIDWLREHTFYANLLTVGMAWFVVVYWIWFYGNRPEKKEKDAQRICDFILGKIKVNRVMKIEALVILVIALVMLALECGNWYFNGGLHLGEYTGIYPNR